jgi:hypothetical protein
MQNKNVPMNKPIFQLSRVSGQPISNAELLADLQRVALLSPATNFVTNEKYTEHGKFDPTTISRRFGTWNKALLAAGLSLSNEFYSDEQLFENLLILWQHYGRQPRKRELSNKPSAISEGPYKRCFGGWIAALTAFVDYANSSEREVVQKIAVGSMNQHITSREPSLRLRWKVLHRDRFTCCHCGRSPAKAANVELRVDHILPWSKDGETVFNNLQTLCHECNLGKSNECETN